MLQTRHMSTAATLVEHKLGELEKLPNGWFCGDGVPVAKSVADYIKKLDKGVLLKTNVYARINGGAGYEIIGKTHELELFFNPDNTFDYIKVDKESNCVDEDDELPWNQAADVIQNLIKEERTSYAPCHSGVLTLANPGSTQDVSTFLQTGRESLSLTKIAPLRKADQFAGTFRSTIPA